MNCANDFFHASLHQDQRHHMINHNRLKPMQKSLIGGKPVTSPLASIDKIYPATGVIAKIEPATREMLDEAVAVAAVAQRSWAAVEPLTRARILHRAAALMREANAELARLEVMDVGKLYSEAESADVPSGTDAFDFFAAAITTQSGDYNKWDGAISYTSRVLCMCRHRGTSDDLEVDWPLAMPLFYLK